MHIAALLQKHGYQHCAKKAQMTFLEQKHIKSRNEAKEVLDDNLFFEKLCNLVGDDIALQLEKNILSDFE